jgi:C-terminal processing protease CtpA/Prc
MRKSVHIFRFSLFLILWITACAPVPPAPTSTPISTKSSTPTIAITPTQLTDAQLYLFDAIDLIQNNALNRDQVDWRHIREVAARSAKGARTPAETYNMIKFILSKLNDHHSHFLTPDEANQWDNSTVEDSPAPDGKLLEKRIGYIAVYTFEPIAEDQVNQYADNIQKILIDLDKQSVCGWIVNLREDNGGNMWPMIAGLGALIGEGEIGAYKDSTGHITKWYYRDGKSWMENNYGAKVSHPDFILDPEKTPVAVLIGSQTASSGESTAISFRGRPNTRFFGWPSAGYTTSNSIFLLPDGAVILLATAVEMDRTGQVYNEKIIPDVQTSHPQEDAIDWLLAQPACNQ